MLNKTSLTLSCLLFALSSDAVLLEQCCGCHLSPCDSQCDEEEPVDPVDPEPVDPEPVDPEPVDPEPVDPEPVDPEPVDPPTDGGIEINTEIGEPPADCCWFFKDKGF